MPFAQDMNRMLRSAEHKLYHKQLCGNFEAIGIEALSAKKLIVF